MKRNLGEFPVSQTHGDTELHLEIVKMKKRSGIVFARYTSEDRSITKIVFKTNTTSRPASSFKRTVATKTVDRMIQFFSFLLFFKMN